jgi:hypothetical protein
MASKVLVVGSGVIGKGCVNDKRLKLLMYTSLIYVVD